MIKYRAVKLAAVAALCVSASMGGGLIACGGNGGGEEGCGCGSSVAGVASLAFGAAILAVALAITMRRKKA